MNPMMTKLQEYIVNAKAQQAGDFDYSVIPLALTRLENAIRTAAERDDEEALNYHVELDRLFEHGLDVFSERQRFIKEGRAVKIGATLSGAVIRALCGAWIEPYADVPAQLKEETQAWSRRSAEVFTLANQAQSQRFIPGWEGKQSEAYSTAVGVQIVALDELRGVMDSTASGCRAGAMIHEGILAAVYDLIESAITVILKDPPASDQYYLRSATATNVCSDMRGMLKQAATGDLAAGAIRALGSECVGTLSLPNLLELGMWPTGTEAAGVIPADTAAGVTHEGGAGIGDSGGMEQSETGVTL